MSRKGITRKHFPLEKLEIECQFLNTALGYPVTKRTMSFDENGNAQYSYNPFHIYVSDHQESGGFRLYQITADGEKDKPYLGCEHTFPRKTMFEVLRLLRAAHEAKKK